MFDRYELGGKDKLVPVVREVHEHRAPTVEQARYLDELRAEARQHAMNGLLVETPLGTFHAERLRDSLSIGDAFVLTWLHQGKQQEVICKISDVEMAACGRDQDKLVRRLAAAFYEQACLVLAWRVLTIR